MTDYVDIKKIFAICKNFEKHLKGRGYVRDVLILAHLYMLNEPTQEVDLVGKLRISQAAISRFLKKLSEKGYIIKADGYISIVRDKVEQDFFNIE